MAELTQDQWALIQQHFDKLADLAPPEQAKRIAKLKLAPETEAELSALLQANRLSGVLDGTISNLDVDEAESYSSIQPGTRIDGFIIDRLVGRGGMGEVYEAHRDKRDFEQRVALKLLRPEAAGQAAMFDRERRLLATLEHPSIARLIDGGIAPDKRPWMAMEFVDGVPVTHWCRDNNAPLAKRLALFEEICAAVSYAHSRLIVHRDIKPSNVLVDSTGHVRLLDFGIAKLVDEGGVVSNTTQAMVTPDYAAPEQLSSENATVSTDVYALGALLYELLTGRGPWRRDNDSLPSIMRRILHDDPPLPSVATLGAPGGHAAAALKGDLDAIIMKAMRRKPEERYASVAELSNDIRRFTGLRPVRARKGTTRYMLGRFIRRNMLSVAAASVAVLALVSGAVGFMWQAQKTAIERDIAVAETRKLEAVNQALNLLFREVKEGGNAENATIKEMLAASTDRLLNSLDNDPQTVTMVTTIADLYIEVEDYLAALTLLEKAKAKGIGAGNQEAAAQIDLRLASVYLSVGKAAQGSKLIEGISGFFEKESARFPKERLEVLVIKAQIARISGDRPTAIALLRASMPLARKVLANNPRDLLTRYNNLLVYMVEAGQTEEMRSVFAEADQILSTKKMQRTAVGLNIRQAKGMYFLRSGKPDEAISIFKAVIKDRRVTVGQDNMGLASDLLQLGRANLLKRQYAEAATSLSEARSIALKTAGPAAPPSLLITLSLAEAYAELGQLQKTGPLLAEVETLALANPKMALFHGVYYRVRAIQRIKGGRQADALKDLDLAEPLLKAGGAVSEPLLKSLPKLRERARTAS